MRFGDRVSDSHFIAQVGVKVGGIGPFSVGKKKMKWRILERWFACVCVTLLGCGVSPDGPQKYPVSGTVLINGQPMERVAVQFHHLDVSVPGNLRFPTAVTDALGRFELSSTGDRDGAVAGDYLVTFAWLSSADIDARDLLGGALSKPEASEFRVSVPIEGNDLPPFARCCSARLRAFRLG